METTAFSNVVEQWQESFKSTLDLYSKASLSIMEAYNKQLAISADVYKQFVESTFKGEFQKSYKTSAELMKKAVDAHQKALTNVITVSKDATENIFRAWSNEEPYAPVSEEITEAILNIFNKQTEMISESGTQFLNLLTKEWDFKSYTAKFDDFVETSVKSSKQAVENLIDVYNQEAEFTQKATKQLTESIAKQFDTLTEMNRKFFNDLMKNFESETPSGNGKGKK